MSTLSANTALTATEPAPPATPREENRAADNDDAMESCCYQQVVGADVTLRPGEFGHAGVTCPYNMGYPQLVMGGGAYNTAGDEVVLTDSYPIRYNQWVVYMKNNSPDRPFVIRAWATCAAFWPINVQPGG